VRLEHLERLRPICPTCRATGRADAQLGLGTATRTDPEDGEIREGVLVCPEPSCQREHPIVDGIPIVVADLQTWVAHQLDSVLLRQDLSPFLESLLGDAAGAGSAFDRERTGLSAYARVHWGDLDSEEPLAREHSLASLLDTAFGLLRPGVPSGLWLDLGCAAGRGTRELALATGDLAVGVDLSFGMLRVAERARRERRAVFPLRRRGLVFDRRDIPIGEMPAERMSFWCCDVANLPFAEATFDGALSLNVVDCVASPVQHLLEMARVLSPGGAALLSTPFDWSTNATPLASWLGGHSQRGPTHGSSVAELRRVLESLEPRVQVEREREGVPWRIYVHERASMDYSLHLLRLSRL
jgi:SAM-dependent methyltransferase/uncharacterized protein YbaR (Trm112 family)